VYEDEEEEDKEEEDEEEEEGTHACQMTPNQVVRCSRCFAPV